MLLISSSLHRPSPSSTASSISLNFKNILSDSWNICCTFLPFRSPPWYAARSIPKIAKCFSRPFLMGLVPDYLAGYPPCQWHSTTDVKRDVHEESRQANSVMWCGTIPRGPLLWAGEQTQQYCRDNVRDSVRMICSPAQWPHMKDLLIVNNKMRTMRMDLFVGRFVSL